jgi:hypothetical protein
VSWFSKHVIPKFKKLKGRDVLTAVAIAVPGAIAVKAGAAAIGRAVKVGRELVKRKAQAEGQTEVEAAAELADELESGARARLFAQENQSSIVGLVLVGGVVVLAILLARRK